MISPLQRSLIINDLTKRSKTWSGQNVMSKYDTNAVVSDFCIERDEKGYYFLSRDLLAYCDLNNGYVFRIRNQYKSWDWKCYAELAQAAENLKSFRVDRPLYREEIVIDGIKWEYSELQSPGQDYGNNFDDDVFSWPELTNGLIPNTAITDELRDQVRDYFKEFVDQSLIVMSQAKSIAEKNNCGMPHDLCTLFARYRDDQGYFWSDFDQYPWIQTKDEIIQGSLQYFGSSLKFAEVCGVLDQSRINYLYQYASETWQQI